jgi:hypothetical protein
MKKEEFQVKKVNDILDLNPFSPNYGNPSKRVSIDAVHKRVVPRWSSWKPMIVVPVDYSKFFVDSKFI